MESRVVYLTVWAHMFDVLSAMSITVCNICYFRRPHVPPQQNPLLAPPEDHRHLGGHSLPHHQVPLQTRGHDQHQQAVYYNFKSLKCQKLS